jgi:3'-phosphoadenosine 5'-phosphosulfate sulfotransferase (PAPS reductase)/FAD synthetase
MEHNIVSVSGGKDSTALLLLAIERQTENLQAVFCDTGNEHPITYEYVQYLNETVFPIKTVKADMSENINRRREKLEKIANGEIDEVAKGLKYPFTPERAREIIPLMQVTGNPFLDLCVARGMFPTTMRRFCSEELKRNVLIEEVQLPLLDGTNKVMAWQGVRADESRARANYVELDEVGGGLWNCRPILKWTVDDVFAMHRKHGVVPNPLYKMGMKRVGCMPCIHAGQDELLEIAKRFPDQIARIKEWEAKVAATSRAPMLATFFEYSKMGMKNADNSRTGVEAQIAYIKRRKMPNHDLFKNEDEAPLCSSAYGLCE